MVFKWRMKQKFQEGEIVIYKSKEGRTNYSEIPNNCRRRENTWDVRGHIIPRGQGQINSPPFC